MNRKTLTKKVIAILIVLLLLGTTTANAAVSTTGWGTGSTSIISSLKQKYSNTQQYKSFLNEFKNYIGGVNTNQNTDTIKSEVLDKIEELQNQYSNSDSILSVSDQLKYKVLTSEDTSAKGLLDTVVSTIKSFLADTGLANKSLKPNVETDIQATTAGKTAGSEYQVKLHGNVYYAAVDENGKPTSTKWVLLIHATAMSGQSITNTLGQMYIDQGFNIIAPDLRGFGDSEGSVAMGYLESLDMWDWLTYLNANYDVSECIAHGVSLGGATTIFLSGLEVDGKTIADQHMIGLVEDCGYTSMMGMTKSVIESVEDNKLGEKILGLISDGKLDNVDDDASIKDFLINKIKTGLTEENFDELQNGLNSLAKCTLPVLIIQGTNDTIVPYENSDLAYNTATSSTSIPYVQRYVAEGQSHAFVVIGMNKTEYTGHVDNFITEAEKIAKSGGTNTGDKVSNYVPSQDTAEDDNVISKVLSFFKNIFKKSN